MFIRCPRRGTYDGLVQGVQRRRLGHGGDLPCGAPTVFLSAVCALIGGLLVACSGSGTARQDTTPALSGPSPAAPSQPFDVTAGLGDPVHVGVVEGGDVADYDLIGRVALTPSGGVWAVAMPRAVLSPRHSVGLWFGAAGTAGVWYGFGSVEDVAVAADGRVWLLSGTSLMTFHDGSWRRVLHENGLPLLGVTALVGIGPDGAVWATANGRLLRYDGKVRVTTAAAPYGTLWQSVVAADGTVWWSGGLEWIWWGVSSQPGWLARFGGATVTTLRPFGGTRDVPALALAADPSGPLWAWMTDFATESIDTATLEATTAEASPVRVLRKALARFDGSRWTLYRDGLPTGYPTSMVARNGRVWMVMAPTWRWGTSAERDRVPTLYRFADGRWSPVPTPLEPATVLAVEDDGTVWSTSGDGVVSRISDSGGTG